MKNFAIAKERAAGEKKPRTSKKSGAITDENRDSIAQQMDECLETAAYVVLHVF
jgi:hypothetical protein